MNRFQLLLVSLIVLLFLVAPALAIAQDDPTLPPAPTQEFITNTPTAAPTVEPTPVEPPVVEEPQEPPAQDPALVALAFWFAMAGAVTGFLEQFKAILLKPAQTKWQFSDEVYSGIAMAVSYITALVLVFTVGEGRTIFDAIGLHISNLIVAQFATAFVVSLGNQALHQLYNLFVGWQTPVLAIEEHREVTIPTATAERATI